MNGLTALATREPWMPDAAPEPAPIVLLGGGHAHVEVVRHLGGMRLSRPVTLVSPARHTPYSGMLPGYAAGEYRFEEFHIDLAALCGRCGVTFLETAATGIDPTARTVTLADGSTLGYSLLSIDTGSTPQLPQGLSGGIPVKPISSFTQALAQLDALAASTEAPLRIAVVGQGVAGVELAFSLQQRFAHRGVQIALAGRSHRPLPDRSKLARRMVERELHRAGISHHADFDAIAFSDGRLTARDGRQLAADEVVWATSSGAPGWLQGSGLALDAAGFIRVDATLRSVSHQDVFAAGDVASLPDPRSKAGVFAVRQGPVLAQNIHHSLTGAALKPYRPQRAWLALISLPGGRAIADKWGLAVCGRWVRRWKHHTDTRFLRRYQTPRTE
ncbi:NADH dehydrogenase [Pannonibacter phragmitetus]|uniref:NADH dehydrogenase n=2 Tax=Pannonibacter phragmitetus TaxID=121719 RepID=A0A378ZYM9_9HYPH|nr:NADH dehydrogenase [Pannonibacter phragmitetus]